MFISDPTLTSTQYEDTTSQSIFTTSTSESNTQLTAGTLEDTVSSGSIDSLSNTETSNVDVTDNSLQPIHSSLPLNYTMAEYTSRYTFSKFNISTINSRETSDSTEIGTSIDNELVTRDDSGLTTTLLSSPSDLETKQFSSTAETVLVSTEADVELGQHSTPAYPELSLSMTNIVNTRSSSSETNEITATDIDSTIDSDEYLTTSDGFTAASDTFITTDSSTRDFFISSSSGSKFYEETTTLYRGG